MPVDDTLTKRRGRKAAIQALPATGLGRASVSTTLSKLASSGEVTKAARGCQLAGPTAAKVPADVGARTENGESGE